MFKYIRSGLCLIIVSSFIFLAGCGGNKQEWAYIHEPEKMILSMSDNGKAIYKDKDYTYSKDDNFIKLTGKDGSEIDMRYVMDGDKMILYERSTYTYDGDGTPDSVIGLWKQDNGWSYQFTEQQTFAEESIFFGHYSVDEDAHTIRLMYDDPIEDAILYYELNGNELTIDYPWPMVKVQK